MLGMTETHPSLCRTSWRVPPDSDALKAFVDAVKAGEYPREEHTTRRLDNDCRLDTAALAEHLTPLRDRAGTIAFVPTMGNLHEGHLALVDQARAAADAVVVSIFVNPMQFAAHEDLDTYPRTLDDDLSALREAGVDLVLTPSADDIYPDTSARHTAIHVPELGEALCGRIDPGTSMACAPWSTSCSN